MTLITRSMFAALEDAGGGSAIKPALRARIARMQRRRDGCACGTNASKVCRPVKIDRELVRAWRALNRLGAVVVALRYSETDHLASALVARGDRRVHAAGWNPAAAIDLCAKQLA